MTCSMLQCYLHILHVTAEASDLLQHHNSSVHDIICGGPAGNISADAGEYRFLFQDSGGQ